MKFAKIILILVLIIGAAALVLVYREMRQERDAEAKAEAPVLAPSRVERSTNGDYILRVDAATQARLGLVVTNLQRGSAAPELIAPARVLDASGLVLLLNQLRSAEVAGVAAQADFDRKKKLFEAGQNAAASAVELADAALQQQQLTIEAARQAIVATWGLPLARRTNLPELAPALLTREAALVRVDLPPGPRFTNLPARVTLSPGFDSDSITAEVLGPAPSTESDLPGQSLLGLVSPNLMQFSARAALFAHVQNGPATEGHVMPRDAIVRHLGAAWAYTKTGADTFTRRVVPLDREHPAGWLITDAWTDAVVVMGAQSLLSEELKGGIQMKD
ncbi:MAG TPA: hypothetical protein VM029_12240 [Opitutaceae bacterium]|nr:hypothetical protein [Opitutaceae bacterium]